MMVVVPTFAKSNQGKQEVISALIFCIVSAAADQMRYGIDAGGSMKQYRGAYDESPDE